jgi:hypothetical protein
MTPSTTSPRNRGEKLVLEDLALDDAASYELLARGDTLGVFQLDGGPMRSLPAADEARQLRRTSRPSWRCTGPGPMGVNSHTNYALRKNGLQQIEPIHPELEAPLADVLDTTYGLIVYQEQVMAAAQKLPASAWAGRHPAPCDGQEEEVRARQAAGGLLRRHDRERLQPRRAERPLEGARVLRGLRLQQGAHRPRTV